MKAKKKNKTKEEIAKLKNKLKYLEIHFSEGLRIVNKNIQGIKLDICGMWEIINNKKRK